MQDQAEVALGNSEKAEAVEGRLWGVRRVSFSLVPLGGCDWLVGVMLPVGRELKLATQISGNCTRSFSWEGGWVFGQRVFSMGERVDSQ